jgi:4-hydroxyphenylacetate decarboxylase small subunit
MANIEKHSDCLNYIPVDVAKGFCVRENGIVTLDSNPCELAKSRPKCKYCSNYYFQEKAVNNGDGICKGFEKESWVYGELSSENCENCKSSIDTK